MSGESRRIRVLTVDDHSLFRKGVATLVNAEADMNVVAEASTGAEAIDLFKQYHPDITLMDLQMPGMGGIETIAGIRRDFPNARIIVLTTYRGDAQIMRALKAGARAYLLKDQLDLELLDAIRAVHAAQKRIPVGIAAELAEHTGDDELSGREIEVLQLIANGNANKEIAARLLIGEATVKGHVNHILGKLEANDRTQAVTIALRRGIIELQIPQK